MYPSFKVRDVRMISDRNSRRSKGIAYIEFVESTSVPLAIGLTGQRVLGVPIIVQASQVRALTHRKSSVRFLFQCMWIILSNCLRISGWEEQGSRHGQHAPERRCRTNAAVRGLPALQYNWRHAQGHFWAVWKGVVSFWNGFRCINKLLNQDKTSVEWICYLMWVLFFIADWGHPANDGQWDWKVKRIRLHISEFIKMQMY